MNKIIITIALFLLIFSVCCAGPESLSQKSCTSSAINQEQKQPDKTDPQLPVKHVDELEEIFEKLREQNVKLKTYQAEIKYLFIQDPEMLDSRILQKGSLYYAKHNEGSRLRINFETRKQDDDDEEKHIEHFIFDGIWLTRIDYQLEKVDLIQQAKKDKPIDVFEFISHHFPMIGFTRTEQLRKQFDISLIKEEKSEPAGTCHLHLKVKKGSTYKDDYSKIDFWIDNKDFLPVKLLATSTEGDIHDILLLHTKVNKNLKKACFKVETPEHFSKNKQLLEEK